MHTQVVADYRRSFTEKIRELEHDADTRAVLAANRAADLGARAAIEWLDEVASALKDDPAVLLQERSTERPRRGRPPVSGGGRGELIRDQCSRSPALLRTFFSPASILTAKRFCLGGSGQLKL